MAKHYKLAVQMILFQPQNTRVGKWLFHNITIIIQFFQHTISVSCKSVHTIFDFYFLYIIVYTTLSTIVRDPAFDPNPKT